MAYQPNVVYAGNLGQAEGGPGGPGIRNKANNIYTTARETSNTLGRIKELLTHIDKYFLGQEVHDNPSDCDLHIPKLNFTAKMGRLETTLQGEVVQNKVINDKCHK